MWLCQQAARLWLPLTSKSHGGQMAYKLRYSDYITPSGPPDPAAWIGPPGPPGPTGPHPKALKVPRVSPAIRSLRPPRREPIWTRGARTVLMWSPVLPLTGGTVTGVLAAPTPDPATNTTQVATTAYVTTRRVSSYLAACDRLARSLGRSRRAGRHVNSPPNKGAITPDPGQTIRRAHPRHGLRRKMRWRHR